MCTYLNEVKLETAEEDIEVFKIVKKDGDKMIAPFQDREYPSNEIESEVVIEDDYFNGYTLNKILKGIHSYVSETYATYVLNIMEDYFDGIFILYKAIIPKGSSFYKGYSDVYYNQKEHKLIAGGGEVFCSNKLIIKTEEIIKEVQYTNNNYLN